MNWNGQIAELDFLNRLRKFRVPNCPEPPCRKIGMHLFLEFWQKSSAGINACHLQ